MSFCIFRSNSMGTCAFGRITTDRVKNSDSITFGASIGSTNNRFVFQMDTWPVRKNPPFFGGFGAFFGDSGPFLGIRGLFLGIRGLFRGFGAFFWGFGAFSGICSLFGDLRPFRGFAAFSGICGLFADLWPFCRFAAFSQIRGFTAKGAKGANEPPGETFATWYFINWKDVWKFYCLNCGFAQLELDHNHTNTLQLQWSVHFCRLQKCEWQLSNIINWSLFSNRSATISKNRLACKNIILTAKNPKRTFVINANWPIRLGISMCDFYERLTGSTYKTTR